MGLLENTIGAMLGHAPGEGSDRPHQDSVYGPLATALIGLLAAKALTGGFGDLGKIFGGGSQAPVQPPPAPGQPGAPIGGQNVGGGLLAGLGGLIQSFQQAGRGPLVQSWVGPGQNQPATPADIEHALGPDVVGQLAQKTGMSPQEVAAQLSQALPGLIDRLTPQGRLPTHEEVSRFN